MNPSLVSYHARNNAVCQAARVWHVVLNGHRPHKPHAQVIQTHGRPICRHSRSTSRYVPHRSTARTCTLSTVKWQEVQRDDWPSYSAARISTTVINLLVYIGAVAAIWSTGGASRSSPSLRVWSSSVSPCVAHCHQTARNSTPKNHPILSRPYADNSKLLYNVTAYCWTALASFVNLTNKGQGRPFHRPPTVMGHHDPYLSVIAKSSRDWTTFVSVKLRVSHAASLIPWN